MTIVRSEVTVHTTDDIPADFIVNTVYHNISANLATGDVGWQSHADEVRDAFTAVDPDDPSANFYANRVVTVKCYDMADGKPRPVKGQSGYSPNAPASASELGPRQVALCLSYYAGRNLPTTRGRIYIGPFNGVQATPSLVLMNQVLALGHALFNIGGENVHWQQHSEKLGVTSTITNWWVDNRWDTQRRRLSKATSRVTGSG